MKILMTTDCVGGVWTYSVDLATYLEREGHEVFIAAMGGSLTDSQRKQLERIGLLGWEFRPLALEWMPGAWSDVDAAGEWLLTLANLHDVDLVHLNGFSHGSLEWGRRIVVVAHSDVVTWWRSVEHREPPPEWDEYRARVTNGLRAADLVVAPTRAMLNGLADAYRFATPSVVIPNARSANAPAAITKEPLMVSAGRVWDPAKNLQAAAAAARDLDWPLVVAGSGDMPGVRSLGPLDAEDVAALFARASIFVEPALYEPFGLAALEAAIAGCALVLGDIPSLREVWENAATYVAPEDDDALAHTLDGLIRNQATLVERQAAARRRAARYSMSSTGGAYAACYETLFEPVTGSVGGRP
ncbi:MAG TPA: glycosyltransferase family 4 protein [Actinomycetota bacterium]|nr:glycosyltransferase family 4 protein [Actinomycetota bacterium]